MTIKNDFKYPFGNPYQDMLTDYKIITSLRNVILMAENYMSTTVPDKKLDEDQQLDSLFTTADTIIAQQSIDEIQKLLDYITKDTIQKNDE